MSWTLVRRGQELLDAGLPPREYTHLLIFGSRVFLWVKLSFTAATLLASGYIHDGRVYRQWLYTLIDTHRRRSGRGHSACGSST